MDERPISRCYTQSSISERQGVETLISDNAIKVMETAAKRVGFCHRDDYPHRGNSPISCGDYKGSSIVSCVFAGSDYARKWVDTCLEELDGLGSAVESRVMDFDAAYGDGGAIAVIMAMDLVAKDEIEDDVFIG